MTKYIVRRLLLLIPVLLGMTLIAFAVTKAVPTDPIIASISQEASNHPEIVAAYRKEWGLDKPLSIQYLTYVKNLLHGDMGVSIYTHRPVVEDLGTIFRQRSSLRLSQFSSASCCRFRSAYSPP